jgi:hypothetical protein
MSPIFAYLDPGSGSLILQALVGGFSGIVVLGRYLWTQYVTRKPVQTTERLSAVGIPAIRHPD